MVALRERGFGVRGLYCMSMLASERVFKRCMVFLLFFESC